MTTEIIAQIANIVLDATLAVVAILISTVVIPWVKSTVIPWLKEKHLYSTIVRFVKAVEKLADSGQIEKTTKKVHVVKLLENKGVHVNEEVLAMIESAVTDLDIAFTSGIVEVVTEVDVDESDEDDYAIVDDCEEEQNECE